MKKNNLIGRSIQGLTNPERIIVWLLAILSPECVSKKVLCNLLMPTNTAEFDCCMANLVEKEWLKNEFLTLSCTKEVADEVFESDFYYFSKDNVKTILENLSNHLQLSPFDDPLEKREYYLVARLFLTCLYEKEMVDIQDKSYFSSLFADVIVKFAENSELSFYGNRRKPVAKLEDRVDFKLLQYAIFGDDKEIMLEAYRLLGLLYIKNFRYDDAVICFDYYVGIRGFTAKFSMALAEMYYQYGDMGQAVMCASRAFLLNREDLRNPENIEVCLFIAYVCAKCDSPENSRRWKKMVADACRGRHIPDGHPLAIKMKIIDAAINQDDKTAALRMLESAELDIYRVYGENAPYMAQLAYNRHTIYINAGQMRQGQEWYGRYVEINHLNYGYSPGDTAIHYSGLDYDNLCRGNINIAIEFSNMSNQICNTSKMLAATVKFDHAYTTFEASLADQNIEYAKNCIKYAEDVYLNEIMPNEEVAREIEHLFINGIIPDSIMGLNYLRTITIGKINLCLMEGRMEDAKTLIKEMEEKESDKRQKMKWKVQMGRMLVEEGKTDEGLRMWKQTVEETDEDNKFSICKDVAEWAQYFGMLTEAINFFELALEPKFMAKGKTSEIAKCLNSYAELLDQYGIKGKIEDMWNNALMFMQSMDDDDGIALLYFQLGKDKQDNEAEILIKKAIEFWKPEKYLFDETLASMYGELSQVQKMLGKFKEANESLNKMKHYSPFLADYDF